MTRPALPAGMTPRYGNWPPPEPRREWGLYHYRCECEACGMSWQDDKGMRRVEAAYKRHWLRRHAEWQFIDPGMA